MSNLFPIPPTVQNPALGRDLAGVTDLTAPMLESTGRQCLVECLARGLMTPRGSVIYDRNWGEDLTALVNADLSPEELPQIQARTVAQFRKDERVINATALAQFVAPSQVDAATRGKVANPTPVPVGVLVITASITDGQGPFQLVLSVSEVTVAILRVQQ